MTENESRTPTPGGEKPLEGWKEIAAYLKRTERTVKRWEKDEALPVRRHQHQARASVYAFPAELDAWLATRQPALEAALPWYRRPASALAMTAALLLALASVASGPLVNPLVAAAQEKGARGMAVRQVWGYGDATGAPSPDGRYLSFVNWYTANLAVRDLTTGENRDLTDEGTWSGPSQFAYYSVWSADSQRVAYTWCAQGCFELRVIGREGGKPTVVYRNPELVWVRAHAWSPEGDRILALFRKQDRTNQIALVSTADGSAQIVKTLDWRYPLIMSLSPDGRTIAYDLAADKDADISSRRDIYLLAADGSRESVLVRHPANDYGPVWTPDGGRVIFASDRTGVTGAWMIGIREGQPHGAARLVNASIRRMFPMGFVGNALYFGYANFENGGNIYSAALDPETGQVVEAPVRAVEQFEGENTSPSWSPDGQYMAYLSRRGSSPFGAGSWTIRIRRMDTGEERELVPKLDRLRNRRDSPPQWSPDARFLLLSGVDLKGREGLYRVDLKTGEAALVVADGDGGPVHRHLWSPDGKTIFFQASRPEGNQPRSALIARDLETGRETALYRGHMDGVALSPDGRQLAFVAQGEQKGTHSLKLLAVTGGTPRILLAGLPAEKFPGLSGLVWTADGRHLIYGFRVGEGPAGQWPEPEMLELWRVSVEGGKPQRLGIEAETLRDLVVHPDGRRLAFTTGNPAHSEVWVLENFLPAADLARVE